MDKFLVTDTDGKKSLTATAFILGFAVVNLKLIASGVIVGKLTLGAFGGGEYAAAVAALGAIYVLRRNLSTGSSTDDKAKE